MFTIVIPEILGVFVTTLIADDKYSDQDFNYFANLNSNTLISEIFCSVLEIYIKF